MLLDKVKHILCISLILLVGVTTLYACKSDDKELQGEPVLQVQKSIGFKKEGGEVAVPVKSNREWNASVTEGKEWNFESNKLAEKLVLIYKEFKKIKLRKELLWKELLVKL